MLEPLVRNNLGRLQGIYDRFPSPARNVLTSARGLPLARLRYSARTLTTLQTLRSHERWSSEQLYAHQLNRIQETIDHARLTVPFYSQYPAVTMRSVEDLRCLPVLSRETVRRNPEYFCSAATPHIRRLRAGTTGTTGSNLTVTYDERTLTDNWAFLLRQWAWAGVSAREPRVTFFGARIVPAERRRPPYWTFNLFERQLLLSIFHLSERTAAAYVECLRKSSGKLLEGFPSVLSILADFVLHSGEPVPMRVIFTSGEPLYPQVRAKFEQAFQTRVFDSYGMTELCGLIQQCEHDSMHLAPDYGFLEILDSNGDPAPMDVEGDMVWTGFLNRTMPLIRYRVGDRGRWLDLKCPCGRSFPCVAPSITRESDLLHLPDGRMFSPRALNQLLKDSYALRFCQFVHDGRDRVLVRAVPAEQGAAEQVSEIRERLQHLLGLGIHVSAELCSEPIKRPGGKIPLIVAWVGA